VMDAGEAGDRLAIGNGAVVNAFQKHADPSKDAGQTQPFGANPNAVSQTGVPAGNPFAAQQAQVQQPQAAAPAVSANPFAQAAPANYANPFAASA